MRLSPRRLALPAMRLPGLHAPTVRYGLAVAALAFVVAFLLPSFGVTRKLELTTQDLRLRLRGERPIHPGIAVVAIDEPALRSYNNSWPIPRDYYALLLSDLRGRGVKAVGIDLLFVGPDKIQPAVPGAPTNDDLLASVIERDPRIVNGVYFPVVDPLGPDLLPAATDSSAGEQSLWWRFTAPLPAGVTLMRTTGAPFEIEPIIAESTAVFGHVALYQDMDGVSRALPLLVNHRGRAFPALALVLAARYLGADWRAVHFAHGRAILPYPGGEVRIPVDSYGRVLISFPGGERVFAGHTFRFDRVLEEIATRAAGAPPGGALTADGHDPLRGTVVLVCNTAATSAVSDFGPTPFDVNFPLAYAHASVLNSILRSDYVERVPHGIQAVAWAILAVLLGVFLSALSPIALAVTALGSTVFLLGTAWAAATFGGALIEIVPPVFLVGAISLGHLLRGYIRRDRQRRAQEQELAVARRIQQDLLPKGPLAAHDLEVAGMNLPCFAVGGDYFDYFNTASGRIAIAVADVSGKGVPAALLMSNLQAIFRAECARGTAVPLVAELANRQLMESMSGSGKFVTFFYGALDPVSRRMAYTNAGHNPPLVVRTDGTLEELSTGGLLLGAFPMATYDEGHVELFPGDLVVLFTDGVTEAERRGGELYGDERLHELLRRERHRGAPAIADAILDDVARFSHGLHQSDDVTVVVVRVAADGTGGTGVA